MIWQLGNLQAALTVILKGPAASENIIWDQVTLSMVKRGLYYADRLIFQLSHWSVVGFESIPAWERHSKPGLIWVELSQMTQLSKSMFLRSIKIQMHIIPLNPEVMMECCKKSCWVIVLHLKRLLHHMYWWKYEVLSLLQWGLEHPKFFCVFADGLNIVKVLINY